MEALTWRHQSGRELVLARFGQKACHTGDWEFDDGEPVPVGFVQERGLCSAVNHAVAAKDKSIHL